MTTFPFTEATPVQFDTPLPDGADVVIIGGGIIGVMTALFLARKNVSVTLLVLQLKYCSWGGPTHQ